MTDAVDGLPLRFVDAGNAGPFTLEGTRTWLVGSGPVVVIDPGPDREPHRRALLDALAGQDRVIVALTHAHADHAAGAPALAAALGAPVVGPGDPGERALADGESLAVGDGHLVAVATPGHAQRHLSFLWQPHGLLFCGDLLLGSGSTTWVGGYRACVADYLASLDRIEALAPRRILPTHGPPIEDPAEAIARYRAHRRERIEQVRRARAAEPGADLTRLVDLVYGAALPSGMRRAAETSVRAIQDFLDG
ncbi:MAG: MBL fold metallo-hydrolase [Gemmatimonadota bacterium]